MNEVSIRETDYEISFCVALGILTLENKMYWIFAGFDWIWVIQFFPYVFYFNWVFMNCFAFCYPSFQK